jgi:hypothetical protein
VQLIVAIGLLWQVLGWASLGGLIVLVLVAPLNFFLMNKQKAFEKEIMALRSKRAKQTNEV